MEKVKIFEYFALGYNYFISLNDSGDRTNSDYYFWLDDCLGRISKLNMPVTNSAIELNELEKDLEKLKKLAKNIETKSKKIENKLHESINQKLKKIDSALEAEIYIKYAYLVEEKRIPTDTLIGNMYKMMPKGHYNHLTLIAQYDITESGYCLAFNRFTAAAFHALRATEEMLKLYYEKLTKSTANDKDNWGIFVAKIQSFNKSKNSSDESNEELIANLDGLRKYYRNKTQHPQLIYSSDEIQDLIPYCIKTITQIINVLINDKLI